MIGSENQDEIAVIKFVIIELTSMVVNTKILYVHNMIYLVDLYATIPNVLVLMKVILGNYHLTLIAVLRLGYVCH